MMSCRRQQAGREAPADDIWLYEHVQRASAAAHFEGIWRGASTVVVGRTNYEGFYSVWPGITADRAPICAPVTWACS